MNKEYSQEPFYCTECDLEGTHHPNGMTLEEIARIHRAICPSTHIRAGDRPPKPIWDVHHYCTQCDFCTVATLSGPSADDIQQLHRMVCPRAEIKLGFKRVRQPASGAPDATAREHIRRYKQAELNKQLTTAITLQDYFSREVARLKVELAKVE